MQPTLECHLLRQYDSLLVKHDDKKALLGGTENTTMVKYTADWGGERDVNRQRLTEVQKTHLNVK